ncbi:hypothetical protein [Planctomicrobium sp. SH527]|uniref:hypothetical protein n=1 Tax=Planctomicrobium sp. SH527 TaxID=3448123 RepID=UPI003F5B6A9E
MHQKITARALEKLIGREADELVSLQVRINTPFTANEIQLLNSWGGTLLFDSGIVAVVKIPVSKIDDFATFPNVFEVQ